MKKLKLHIYAIACLTLVISCDSDDKVLDEVLETYTSGAVLRTLDSSGSFDMFRTDRTFAVTVEEQDDQNGELIDRVDITVDFVDNNKEGATGDDTNLGVPFATLTASDFTIGERGLPTADFSYTMAEALTALGIDLTEVLPGDRIAINLELFFTDGRSFKASDAAVTVTGGSFFSSPFAYALTISDGITFGKKGVFPKEVNTVPGEILNDYSVNISIDDREGGDLLETLNIYRTFRDLTIGEDGTNLSQPEALIATFEIASLTLEVDPDDEDDSGTRTLSYVIPSTPGDVLSTGITLDQLALGDDFSIRYEIITADGRIVTTDEGGTEYFDVIPTTECVQLNLDTPVPGEYTIEFEDSFGDGWDGAFISVDIDGSSTDYTLESGSSGTTSFTVPEGAGSLILTYVDGSFEEEHSYTIVDPNGLDAFADGPNPNVGVIPIKVCQPED
ncbi:hypothetical protein [Maribacter aestuarii]|uniref:hypothetical protein n=1 Tax=Maribacter aestuarii TaxID=1130723 RepID=UPI0025A65344|nr:hypothetical protein [Maribacter aestuarii]